MRSIFLERILKSFVGSIDEILNELKTSVEGIVDDMSTIDGQLDSVKDKMDEVIVSFGQGTKSVLFSNQNTDNHVIVNPYGDIVCDTNSATLGVNYLYAYGDGPVQLRVVYDESVNAADQDPPATKKSNIFVDLTHTDGTNDLVTIGTTTGVPSSGTPQQGKEIIAQITVRNKDYMHFYIVNGSAVSGNTTPATIKGIYIDYSLVSVTEPGGAFVPVS